MPSDAQDCLILGQRQFSKTPSGVEITIPIDHKKASSAEVRVKAYHEFRQKEIQEEELELQQKNNASHQQAQSSLAAENKDVATLNQISSGVEDDPLGQNSNSRNKSRSNISAI